MILNRQPAPEQPPSLKWFNSPITRHAGTLASIRHYIPSFERRPFELDQPGNVPPRINEHLDMIVRQPFGEDKTFIPIGVVSKDYAFVPHTSVLDIASAALESAKIAPATVKAELRITAYGERMALSLYLPDAYNFDPGDGNSMALRLECLNSVDGSTRFRALMGWFRFVCSNGLVIGVTRSDIRRRHSGDLHLQDVGSVLLAGIKEAEAEKKNLKVWRARPLHAARFTSWVKQDLRKQWGFKAATRAYHIVINGHDVEITGQYKMADPTTIQVSRMVRVPGAPARSETLFDLSQVLAWLAKERRDIQEQIEWREQIPELLAALTK